MIKESDILRELRLERELFKIDAKDRFRVFLNDSNPLYARTWYHTLIANYCQKVLEGEIRNLMVFVPPQHGKSEIVSRNFPAWALGKCPDLKIVGSSYSADLAQQFSRSIQRTIDSPEYHDLFPETYLNGSNVRTNAKEGYIRNVDLFEIVGHRGFYKAVGVCGGLTGTPVDIGIIDDPVKDAIEAYSETYRARVWDWYVNVFLTRLHNDSRQIFIMTRWHDDDLAGRLLKKEPEKWTVLRIPAIRESLDDGNTSDPRSVGEALWPEKHSIERLREAEGRSPRTFASLYQQRPSIDGGNIVKKEWFKHISRAEFERMRQYEPIHFFCDTAYTEKSVNDPTGVIGVCKIGFNLYVVCGKKVRLPFPDLLAWLPKWIIENGYGSDSTLRIEPKASGISLIQAIERETGINVTRTPTPTESKETRLNVVSPTIECGRVYVIDDYFADEFIEEICGFPAKPHDEYVDVLCYAIDYYNNKEDGAQDDLGDYFD